MLTNWLVFRKNPPEQVEGDIFGAGDPKENEKRSMMQMLTYLSAKKDTDETGLLEHIRRKISG